MEEKTKIFVKKYNILNYTITLLYKNHTNAMLLKLLPTCLFTIFGILCHYKIEIVERWQEIKERMDNIQYLTGQIQAGDVAVHGLYLVLWNILIE